jgi:succinyl-CoA synthetase beta subunit
MNLLAKAGVKTPLGYTATTLNEVDQAIRKLKSDDLVIKAQVLAGGRGKGHFTSGLQGGVKVTYEYPPYIFLYKQRATQEICG